MSPEELITTSTDDLMLTFCTPGKIALAEEEVLIAAELLSRDDLTIGQRLCIRRVMTDCRRLYNYQAIMAALLNQRYE